MFAVAALVGALGQYLYKSGADRAGGGVMTYLANMRLWAGVLFYVVVMVLFVAAFKKGGSLAVLYSIYASAFIWAAIIGFYAYGTPIRPLNVAGMYLMGR